MEEEFKKRIEEFCDDKETFSAVGNGGLEGEGKVLDNVLDGGGDSLKEGIEEVEVLEGGFEGLEMNSIPSWEASRVDQEGCSLVNLQDVCMEEGHQMAASGEVVGEVVGQGENVESCTETEQIAGILLWKSEVAGVDVQKQDVLNWKKVVVGGGEAVKASGANGVLADTRVEKKSVGGGTVAANRSGVGGGNKSNVKEKGGGSVKVCREIVFDEGGGGFIA